MATQMYDVKTVEVAKHTRGALPIIAHNKPYDLLYSSKLRTPKLEDSQVASLINAVK